ncbi:MAG: hypothetical protein HQ522_16245 [Bacteroidetes bacterium]|nr:hypothetical protein [Bacteroidota bacterium]
MLPEVRRILLPELQKETRAVEVRKKAIEFPEVKEALNKVEYSIMIASTKQSIAEIETRILVDTLAQVMVYIKKDIGLRTELDEYDMTRFADVLRKYYYEMSLSEIKLAFELSIVGELNDFLPKKGNGDVENNHYQQFNVEYYSKILKAYKKKKNTTITKAYDALPKHSNQISIDEKKRLYNGNLHNLTLAFYRYKYTGIMYPTGLKDLLYSRALEKTGLMSTININDSDIDRAMSLITQKAEKRLLSQFQANSYLKHGAKSYEVNQDAYFVARRREIKECFDWMVKNEVQIINYLKFV